MVCGAIRVAKTGVLHILAYIYSIYDICNATVHRFALEYTHTDLTHTLQSVLWVVTVTCKSYTTCSNGQWRFVVRSPVSWAKRVVSQRASAVSVCLNSESELSIVITHLSSLMTVNTLITENCLHMSLSSTALGRQRHSCLIVTPPTRR